jgi:hypothetical protein
MIYSRTHTPVTGTQNFPRRAWQSAVSTVNIISVIFLGILSVLLLNPPAHAAGFRQVEKTTQFRTPGQVHSITPLNGNLMLLAAEGEGVILADFGQADAPRIISTARYSAQAESISVSPSGQRVYVANGAGGLDILALSSNGEFALLGRMDTPSYAFDVAISPDSKVAYVADNTNGVVVVDVSQSAQPRTITTIPTQGSAAGVLLSGNGQTLYIADQAGGIHIVNVRTPFSPQTISRTKTQGHAQSIVLSGDERRLFTANNTGGLQIFEISQPQTPRLTGQLDIQNAFAVTLSTDNRTLLVADLFNGLKTVNVSQPGQPLQLTSVKTNGTAEGVTVMPDQTTVLVAGGEGGVNVVHFR